MKLTFGNDRVFGLAMHSLVPRPLKRTLPSAFAHATYRTMDVASVYIVTRRVGPPDELTKADFVAASRVASMSSMGLFAPIGEVDMKSAPGDRKSVV